MLRPDSPSAWGGVEFAPKAPLLLLWGEESCKETPKDSKSAWDFLHNLGNAEMQAKPHDPHEGEKKTLPITIDQDWCQAPLLLPPQAT